MSNVANGKKCKIWEIKLMWNLETMKIFIENGHQN